jgi:hypothetical protein
MKKLMMAIVIGLFVFGVAASPGWGVVGIPRKISFQGRITNALGPINSPTYLKFSITGSAGEPDELSFWNDAFQYVYPDQNGVFNVVLPRDGSDLPANLDFSGNLYLHVRMDPGNVWLGAQPFTSVPYAFRAEIANSVMEGGSGVNWVKRPSNNIYNTNGASVGVGTFEPTTGYKMDINGNLLVRGSLEVWGGVSGLLPKVEIYSADVMGGNIGYIFNVRFLAHQGQPVEKPEYAWTWKTSNATLQSILIGTPMTHGATDTDANHNNEFVLATTSGYLPSNTAIVGVHLITAEVTDKKGYKATHTQAVNIMVPPLTIQPLAYPVGNTLAGEYTFSVDLASTGGVGTKNWAKLGAAYEYASDSSIGVPKVVDFSSNGHVVFSAVVNSEATHHIDIPVSVTDDLLNIDSKTIRIDIDLNPLLVEIAPDFKAYVKEIDPSGPVTNSDISNPYNRLAILEHMMGLTGADPTANISFTNTFGKTKNWGITPGSNLANVASKMSALKNGAFLNTGVALTPGQLTTMLGDNSIPASKISGTLSLGQIVPSVPFLPTAGTAFGVTNGYGTMLNLPAAAGGYAAGTYQNQLGGSWHRIATSRDIDLVTPEVVKLKGYFDGSGNANAANYAVNAKYFDNIAFTSLFNTNKQALTSANSLALGGTPAASFATQASLANYATAANLNTTNANVTTLQGNFTGTAAKNSLALGGTLANAYATQAWVGQLGYLTGSITGNVAFKPAAAGGAVPGIYFSEDPAGATYVAALGYIPATTTTPAVSGMAVRNATDAPGTGWEWAFQVNNSTKIFSTKNLAATNIGATNTYTKLVSSTIANVGYIGSLSDLRLKSDITPVSGALGKVAALQGVSYKWKDAAAKGLPTVTQLGLIAQDVEKVAPELVSDAADGYKQLNYNGMSALFVESIKELKAENEKLRGENEAVKARLKALEEKIK